MVEYNDNCVGCAQGCMGSGCPYKNVPSYSCDDCGCDLSSTLYQIDDHDFCSSCFTSYMETLISEMSSDIVNELIRTGKYAPDEFEYDGEDLAEIFNIDYERCKVG